MREEAAGSRDSQCGGGGGAQRGGRGTPPRKVAGVASNGGLQFGTTRRRALRRGRLLGEEGGKEWLDGGAGLCGSWPGWG